MQALGMIETRGLVPAIEALDAMLKSADVTLVEKTIIGGGLVTITGTGDVSAVHSAVDAGTASVERFGEGHLVTSHIIARPHEEVTGMFDPRDPSDPSDDQEETAEADRMEESTEETDEEDITEEEIEEMETAEEEPDDESFEESTELDEEEPDPELPEDADEEEELPESEEETGEIA